MKNGFLTFSFLFFYSLVNGQIFTSDSLYVKFESNLSPEPFSSQIKDGKAAFNIQSGKVAIFINMKSFKLSNELMNEDFHTNYLETNKYMMTKFTGEILDLPDLKKAGEYSMKVKGIFEIHGVQKSKIILVNFIVAKDLKISVNAHFKIIPKEFNIQIANIVIAKIAKEIDIIISSDFSPKN